MPINKLFSRQIVVFWFVDYELIKIRIFKIYKKYSRRMSETLKNYNKIFSIFC